MSPRPLCEGLPGMCRTEVEEAKDHHQEEHAQPDVQRGHHLRHPPWERGASQPVHHGDGLRPVGSVLEKKNHRCWIPFKPFGTFPPPGWDTTRSLVCVAPGQMLRVWDEITGTKCWLTHANPLHTGTPWERYKSTFTNLFRTCHQSVKHHVYAL